jgi:hypothetical protein
MDQGGLYEILTNRASIASTISINMKSQAEMFGE